MKITVRDLLDDYDPIELDKHARVEFGEGVNRVTIFVIDDMIHICADSRLVVMPRAANLIWVKGEWK